jgi:molybdopterin-containing oxidoreductase family iron-sulfur binding subunit
MNAKKYNTPREPGRRKFLKDAAKSAVALAAGTCFPAVFSGCNKDDIDNFLQKHFTELTPAELEKLLRRIERQNLKKYGKSGTINAQPPMPGVSFGYALDLSRCIGCRQCVHACVKENNQTRDPAIQWIRVLEFPKEKGIDFAEADPYYCFSGNGNLSDDQKEILANPLSQYPLYQHAADPQSPGGAVPRKDHFYVPIQCQQCENPPCVKVCPVKATWKDADGIVVIDYNWCIGCRYCMAACPYGARHFNWAEPKLPADEINPDMHYLGNRPRMRGVVEKCTYCIQRTRKGRYPACVEICPVGARKFGNLLDPESEIRHIIEHKRVLVLKNELDTHPKFFYFYGL